MANSNIFFDVENDQNTYEIDTEQVESFCPKMVSYLIEQPEIIEQSALCEFEIKNLSLCFDVLICDNADIREINKEYRKKDKPTDVISFALFADQPENRFVLDDKIHLGQIIISAEKTDEQAKESGKTFFEEFYFLLSHSILHLFGFDHKDEKSLEFMFDLQHKMVASFEVENVEI